MNTSSEGEGKDKQPQAASSNVQEVVNSAARELHALLARRAELMKRIAAIKRTLAGLADIFGDSVLSAELLTALDRKPTRLTPGLTQACRIFLKESDKPVGARLVCQALQQKFPELLERNKNPVASVTTILKRLVHRPVNSLYYMPCGAAS